MPYQLTRHPEERKPRSFDVQVLVEGHRPEAAIRCAASVHRRSLGGRPRHVGAGQRAEPVGVQASSSAESLSPKAAARSCAQAEVTIRSNAAVNSEVSGLWRFRHPRPNRRDEPLIGSSPVLC
jgi:hypothetical protein